MSFSNGARQSSNDTSQSRSVADADGIRKRTNAKASSGIQALFTIICTYDRILESFQIARVRLEQRGFSSVSANPASGRPYAAIYLKRLQAYAARRIPACQTSRVPGWLSASH